MPTNRIRKKQISIVVAVYNVESFLKKCITSILAQTYDNLEIILVDDGSTDKSGEICDYYKQIDARIKVIHKKNGGLSEARNYGIDFCTAQYITFVDSDDFLADDYIENLATIIENSNADIAITCAYKFYDEKKCQQELFNPQLTKIYDSEQALSDFLYRKNIPVYAWGKLYSIQLFNEIRFPVGELFEDLSTGYLLFDQAKIIAFNPVRNYFYRQRKGSIVNSHFDHRKMIQLKTTEKIVDFVEKKYPRIIFAAASKSFITALNLYRNIPLKKEFSCDRNEAKKIVKKYRNTVLHDKENKFFTRLLAAVSLFNIGVIRIGGILYQMLLENNVINLKRPI